VLYTCYDIFDDGHCKPDSTFVDIVSRHKHGISADVRKVITKTLNDVCYQLGDFEAVSYYGLYSVILSAKIIIIIDSASRLINFLL